MGRHATPEVTHINSLTCDSRDAMPHQRSLTHSHVTCGMPCHTGGHSHTHMWLAGCHAAPGVTHTLACDLRGAMSRQGWLHSYQEKGRISLGGGNHFEHVPLLTCLGWLQPIYYNSWHVFIKTVKISLVVKTLNKKHRATSTLISSSRKSKIKIIAPSKNTFQNRQVLKVLPQKMYF